jgi:phosphoribosylanthranilate isomerase
MNKVQVKICGITNTSQAMECARLGADAIGIVFYERSPRNVSVISAGRIARSVNGAATPVAVTVDMPVDELLYTAMSTGISVFQLHGNETPDYVNRLRRAGLRVIKHIKGRGTELNEAAQRFEDAYAFIVECGKGELPGGNGAVWDFSCARSLGGEHPFVLAGGLDCENVSQAIVAADADAVDVSSALEAEPGIKDMKLVEKFIIQAKNTSLQRQVERIF